MIRQHDTRQPADHPPYPPFARGGFLLSRLPLVIVLIGASPALALAQEPSSTTTADPLTEIKVVERVTAAVDRSLAYLAAKQKADGSWHNNNAVNALSLLAFMGRGHVPGHGPYRDILERGKKFLLSSTHKDNGFISFSSMYEHGLATLALAEMYGMDPDPELEKTLRKAVDLIIKSQSPSGGWRYQPHPGDQDLSVTVMQIVALRAANNAEIPVPAGCDRQGDRLRPLVLPLAVAATATPPVRVPDRRPRPPGILSLQLLGKFDDKGVARALQALRKYPVKWDGSIQYFFYFHYYAIQASYQAGGANWNDWHPQGARAAPLQAERRRHLGRPRRHRRGQRGRRRPQQDLLDCHGLPDPRDLHALPAGVSEVSSHYLEDHRDLYGMPYEYIDESWCLADKLTEICGVSELRR